MSPPIPAPLPLEYARAHSLCRICAQAAPAGTGSPLVLNFGKEYAHQQCLDLADKTPVPTEAVDHPSHYGGKDNPYEVIKVLKAWGLEEDALLWNMGKYLGRWKSKDTVREQLAKAIWYGLRRLAILDGLPPDTYNDANKETTAL